MPTPGFRVKMHTPRPDPALLAAFGGIPSSNIGDAMQRISCMAARIRPLNACPLLGCAFTVRLRPGDNLLLHKAVDMAQPGDILVVDAGGSMSCAVVGDLMLNWCRQRKVGGIIVDGCVRDADTLRHYMDFPVYAAGITPRGPSKDGGGEIGFPVVCGDLVVCPGDILAGDADGVVVIPLEDAAGVLEEAKKVCAKEESSQREIAAGTWNRIWVDELLQSKGCEFIE